MSVGAPLRAASGLGRGERASRRCSMSKAGRLSCRTARSRRSAPSCRAATWTSSRQARSGCIQRLLKNDTNNFAPRIGIAYRPWGESRFSAPVTGSFTTSSRGPCRPGAAPFVINEPNFTNPTTAPTVIFRGSFPSSVGGPTQVGLPSATRRDLRTPYSMQYNFTVERQQWNTGFRISYIGTNTRQGEWGYNINQPLPIPGRFIDKPRRFPNYPAITYIDNGAGHHYHSLTFEMERRYARGLAYQFLRPGARHRRSRDEARRPRMPTIAGASAATGSTFPGIASPDTCSTSFPSERESRF